MVIIVVCQTARSEGSPPDYPYFRHQLQAQGLSQTTLRLDNLLEGVTELTENYNQGLLQGEGRS